MPNFCKIIKSDEINIDDEDLVFDSAVLLMEQDTSTPTDIKRCIQLIRFEHMTKDNLLRRAFGHPLMGVYPQKGYIKEALQFKLQAKEDPTKPARLWKSLVYPPERTGFYKWMRSIMPLKEKDNLYYINKHRSICLYRNNSNESMTILHIPSWMGGSTSIHPSRFNQQLFIAGGDNAITGAHVSILTLSNQSETILPALPVALQSPCIVATKQKIFVIGGRRYIDNLCASTTVYRFNFNQWLKISDLPTTITDALIVAKSQFIYIIGGVRNDIAWNKL